MRMAAGIRIALAVAALALAAGCAGTGAGRGPHAARVPRVRHAPAPPEADSVTIALWRFDENGGTRCGDAGPFRLTGTAGLDTHTDFGRFRSARVFQRGLVQSFAEVPFNPEMNSSRGFTVETWVYLNSTSPYELQALAARWTPVPNQQSWVLGVTGQHYSYPNVGTDSPGWFNTETLGFSPNHVVFIYQPAEAAGDKAYASTGELPLQRWVHVAVTLDSRSVRFWINGQPDAQFATLQTLRDSDAPLVMGNVFDTRRLTDFGGDLRVDETLPSPLTFYQLDGDLDEMRLSNAARRSFESLDSR